MTTSEPHNWKRVFEQNKFLQTTHTTEGAEILFRMIWSHLRCHLDALKKRNCEIIYTLIFLVGDRNTYFQTLNKLSVQSIPADFKFLTMLKMVHYNCVNSL